ncbi:MAG: ABC transporter permease [Lentisphaeria bacterium]|jgi:phospholipid/cholesterol/gamma-HCH transport system permease protein
MKVHEPEYWAPPANFLAAFGRAGLLKTRNAGRAVFLLLEACFWLPDVLARRREFVRQIIICGIKSLLVTSTVALFTGMILALQAGLVLKDYGQQVQVGTLVSQSMCREMGPFMTALILAASVGAAMAAELGTMTVSEEVAALQVMSINPVRFLVMPRLAAMILACPALTIFSNVVGILGGMLVADTQLGVSPQAYYDNAMLYLHNKEVYVGLLKALVFGVILTIVACHAGLSASNGAVGVGRATRQAVVTSFLLILVSGYVITRFFY